MKRHFFIPFGCSEQRKGESPLLVACREGDQTMVEALLRYGADPGLSDYANNTPGSVALAGQHRSIADIIAKSVSTRGDTRVCVLDEIQ